VHDEVKTFATTTSALLELNEFLSAQGVTHVAMEAHPQCPRALQEFTPQSSPHTVGCKYACDGFERAFHVLSTCPPIDNANAHRAVPLPGRSAKKRGAFTIDCLDGPVRLRVVICRNRVGTAVEKSH
jgi:hypothetical protein